MCVSNLRLAACLARAAARGLHPCVKVSCVQLRPWSTQGFCQRWALPNVWQQLCGGDGFVRKFELPCQHQHLKRWAPPPLWQ